MISSRIRKFALSFVAALLLFMQSAPALADTGNGLSISPTRSEITLQKGGIDSVTISVKNFSSSKIVAKGFINDFEADGDTGAPRLIVDRSKEISSNSISTFVSGLDDLSLDPGETKQITLGITIPENAISGAYYGAVRYLSQPDTAAGAPVQVSLSTSVASLILITIPGEITNKIQIKNAIVYRDNKAGSFFVKTPNQIGLEVKNLGNGFAKPFGKVAITNMLGHSVASYEMNDTTPKGVVLPNTQRNFKNPISALKMPGRYKIQANIADDSGQILQLTSTFWFMPLWFDITLAIMVLVVLAAAFYFYRRYKSRTMSRR